MSKNAAIFTPLAADARAEDVAARIHAMISVMPEAENLFLQKFTDIIDAKRLEFSHSAASAALNLKETHQAALGERGISKFLRRFLTSPAVRQLVENFSPAYEEILAKKNGAAVAVAAASLGKDISNVPEKASFARKGRAA